MYIVYRLFLKTWRDIKKKSIFYLDLRQNIEFRQISVLDTQCVSAWTSVAFTVNITRLKTNTVLF